MDNVNPSDYNFNSTFPRINWNYATTYEIETSNPYTLKTRMGIIKSP